MDHVNRNGERDRRGEGRGGEMRDLRRTLSSSQVSDLLGKMGDSLGKKGAKESARRGVVVQGQGLFQTCKGEMWEGAASMGARRQQSIAENKKSTNQGRPKTNTQEHEKDVR